MEPKNVLANISRAKQILAEARDITDVLDIRDVAVAAHAYAKAKNADDAAQMAMELKLRSERRAGEFLQGSDLKPGRPKNTDKMSALSKLGISQQESSRWQRIARIPSERFEEYLVNAIMRTQSALLSEAGRLGRSRGPVKFPRLPKGKFRCLIIDPPWPMQKILRVVRPMQEESLDYPTIDLKKIEKDIGKRVRLKAEKEGCHVYLWSTHKYLPTAFKFFTVWGIKYQCLLTWVKPTGMTPFSWMYNTEHCLFGRIGNLKLLKDGVKLSFEERVREHSRKPDIFYEIVRKVSPGPRLDMFARESHEGFQTWGDETDRFTT